MNTINQFNKTINELNVSLRSFESRPLPVNNEEIKAFSLEGKTLEDWVTDVKKTNKRLKDFLLDDLSNEDGIEALELQSIALQYRTGFADKAEMNESTLFEKAKALFQLYKEKSDIYPGGDGQLTPSDLVQIQKACQKYPLFIEYLIKSHEKEEKGWSESKPAAAFAKWALRSECSVGVFVKVPNERELLSRAHLDKRSGAIDKTKGIKFSKVDIDGKECKVLTIKMNHKYVPIQGKFKEQEVELPNLLDSTAEPYRLTAQAVIDQCRRKTTQYGNVEYLEGGLSNWNSINLSSYNPSKGYYEPFDPNQKDFLKNLPNIKTISEKDLQLRYPGQNVCQDGEWGFVIKAARVTPTLKIRDNHAFFEVIMPVGNGIFKILPIGLQPLIIPETDKEKFLALGSTMPANIHFPDECVFLSNREHASLFFRLKNEEVPLIEKEIRRLMVKGNEGQLFFQPMGDNCAYFVQTIFDHLIGKRFNELLENLVDKAFFRLDEEKRSLLLRQAIKQFDDAALDRLLDGLVSYLLNEDNHDELHTLITTSVETLNRTLFQKEIIGGKGIASEDLRPNLKKLLKLVIESHRLFKIDLFECEYESILKPFAVVINSIPWKALRHFVASFVIFLFLASWRTLEIPSRDIDSDGGVTTTTKTKSLSTHRLANRHYLYLPASFFQRIEKQSDYQEEFKTYASKIFKTLTVREN